MKRIIFVHVPKTAGSSFVYYLYKVYSKKYKFIRDTEKYWRKVGTDVREYESNDIIYGHFHYSKYMHLNGRMITLLRNPVERVISQYYYSNKPEDVDEDISLEDYASLEVCRNMIAKQLGNLDNFDFIGFQETFNNTLLRAEKFLGIKFLQRRDIKYRNNKKGKKFIDDKVKKYIEEMNREDIKMYKAALGGNDENNKRLDR